MSNNINAWNAKIDNSIRLLRLGRNGILYEYYLPYGSDNSKFYEEAIDVKSHKGNNRRPSTKNGKIYRTGEYQPIGDKRYFTYYQNKNKIKLFNLNIQRFGTSDIVDKINTKLEQINDYYKKEISKAKEKEQEYLSILRNNNLTSEIYNYKAGLKEALENKTNVSNAPSYSIILNYNPLSMKIQIDNYNEKYDNIIMEMDNYLAENFFDEVINSIEKILAKKGRVKLNDFLADGDMIMYYAADDLKKKAEMDPKFKGYVDELNGLGKVENMKSGLRDYGKNIDYNFYGIPLDNKSNVYNFQMHERPIGLRNYESWIIDVLLNGNEELANKINKSINDMMVQKAMQSYIANDGYVTIVSNNGNNWYVKPMSEILMNKSNLSINEKFNYRKVDNEEYAKAVANELAKDRYSLLWYGK